MALICGHLVERGADGLYTPLGIAAYEVGKAPNIVAASDKVPNDYYSLIDSGGQAALQGAYGAGSGNLTVQGEDRLEVTVRPIANCVAPNPGKAVIKKAVDELSSYVVNRSNIYYATSAAQEEMSVNYLVSISKNASGAATPIVNIGGSVFFKQDQKGRRDYISINPVKVDTTLAAPVGSEVTSPEPITTSPLAKTVLAAPTPPSTPPLTLPTRLKCKGTCGHHGRAD
ncbi:hypothetical protein [Rhodopila sp.]|uniref:hypothetical protein n=1 Tax=Rhodopila sp. TaxID=2480087 RepID=UPI002BF5E22D|nr:hypothetical protein [Rhodopila sp.]HVZ07564.1 hypothetical protein [Rhodopila sp.]